MRLVLSYFSVLAVLAAFVAGAWFTLFAPTGELSVSLLDVGQGDAILIQTPTRQTILTDAGPDARVVNELGEVLPYFHRRIDLAILTHPDLDHIAGFIDVLHRYDVGAVLMTGVLHDSAVYTEILQLLAAKHIPVELAEAEHDIDFGDGVKLDVLWPIDIIAGRDPTNNNTTSIVTRVTFGKTSVLLTGDAEETAETALRADHPATLKSDVLKLGHHGSRTSSSQLFLDAVRPTIALVSAGCDNQFGHPSPETLARLPRAIQIYDTCKNGTVTLTSDGAVWQVTPTRLPVPASLRPQTFDHDQSSFAQEL